MSEPPTVTFTAVDHVGIAVPDLDAAIAFYRDTFGLRLVHEETNTDQGVREAMLAPGGAAAGSAGSDRSEGSDGPDTQVQLLAPLTDDSPIARFLDRHGPGVQQVAYRVDDVAAASRALRAKGLRVLYDEPRPGTAGSRVNFVHPKDTGGVLIELVEPAEGAAGRTTWATRR